MPPLVQFLDSLDLCLLSLACSSIVGQRLAATVVVGLFGDEVMTATLPQDTWRTRHDAFKVVIVNMANEARIPIHCAVFGLFRDLIPAQLLEECCEPFCLLEFKGRITTFWRELLNSMRENDNSRRSFP